MEACIYGIDYNPLAVELSKLSLWLTCIASSEPLSFLDHHLIAGNSLIGARLDSMATLPSKKDTSQIPISFGPDLKKTVADAIQRIEAIETEASSSIEIVKKKENLWRKEVMERLKPFKTIGDLWIATLAGLKLDESLYHKVSAYLISPQKSKGVKEEWGKLESPYPSRPVRSVQGYG